MENNEKITLKDTPEKYAEMAKEIVPPFLRLLESIIAHEDAAFKVLEEQEAEKVKLGIPKHREHPGFMDFINNYREQYKALVSESCTKKLLDRPFGGSIHHPAKYIDAVEGQIFFTMKSAKKAIIVIENPERTRKKHRFVLVNEDGIWKVDEVKYGFGDIDKWYIDHI